MARQLITGLNCADVAETRNQGEPKGSPNKMEKNMTIDQLQYILTEVLKQNNEPIDKTFEELTSVIKRMTEMIMNLDERVKFDNQRIKELEHELYELTLRVGRQDIMIISQGMMPLE